MSHDTSTTHPSWLSQFVPVDKSAQGRDETYAAGQRFFDPIGVILTEAGWSVFPQTRDERRGPDAIKGRPIRWREFIERRPTRREVQEWANNCPDANVAAIMGPASGHALAIDLDVAEPDFAAQIESLAVQHLGPPGLRRMGRRPALMYRQAEHGEIGNKTHRFVPTDGDKSDIYGAPAIEILAKGKPLTIYGNHHKTGRYFSWDGPQPLSVLPEELPVITATQLQDFLHAVQKLRPFAKAARPSFVDGRWDYDANKKVHRPRTIAPSDDWSTGEDGKVTDGREAFLFRLVGLVVRSNPDIALSRGGLPVLCGLIEQEFRARAEVTGRWASDSFLRGEIEDKTRRSIAEATAKNTWRRPISVDAEAGTSAFPDETPQAVQAERPADMAWLDPSLQLAADRLAKGRGPRIASLAATEESKQAAEMLPRERRIEEGQRVAAEVRGGVNSFTDYVYSLAPDAVADRIHGIQGPTGSGKTVSVVKGIAQVNLPRPPQDRRTFAHFAPSHALADEVKGVASSYDMVDVLDEAAAAATEAGLHVLHFKGRISAGCHFSDQMERLTAAGLEATRLCITNDRDPETGEKEIKRCSMWQQCTYRRQLQALSRKNNDGEVDETLPKVDLVLLPHAYITGPIPKELKDGVDAPVYDESVWRNLIATVHLPMSALRLARMEPSLTKEEQKAKPAIDPHDFIVDRDHAAEIVEEAFKSGRDVAAEFLKLSRRDGMLWIHEGLSLVRSALRCANATKGTGRKIHPDMMEYEITNVLQAPERELTKEEAVFWSVVEDRLEALTEDLQHDHQAAMMRDAGIEPPIRERMAKGDRDARLQFVVMDRNSDSPAWGMRVSWRRKRNFASKPTLLLDASLSPRIVTKLFPGRELVLTSIKAPLALRTVLVLEPGTDTGFIPSKAQSLDAKLKAVARSEMWMHGISRLCGIYATSGVLVAADKTCREYVERSRPLPPNADFLHLGNGRGFDFAKNHSAIYSYGRLETPYEVIDAYVAALTYDDDEPEAPYDHRGDGMTPGPKGKPVALMPPKGARRILMRDGTYREIEDTMHAPGSWAREVQIQLREEEARQMVGRLRPVYRYDTDAVWVNVGRCVPDGIVVDEIVSLTELVRPGAKGFDSVFEAARRSHGCVDPGMARGLAPDLLVRDEQSVRLSTLESLPSDRERLVRVRVRYRIEGQDRPVERTMVDWDEDLEGAVRDLNAALGTEMVEGSIEVLGSRPARAPVQHKRPDKVDRARSAWTAQELADFEAEHGSMALRAALSHERGLWEKDALSASWLNVCADMGRQPKRDELLALPVAKNIPRSRAKVRLAQRALLDAAKDPDEQVEASGEDYWSDAPVPAA